MPKAKMNGVSFIEARGVVWYAHNILGSSSTHLSLASSSLVLRPWRIVRFITLTFPLIYGWPTYMNRWQMCKSTQNSLNAGCQTTACYSWWRYEGAQNNRWQTSKKRISSGFWLSALGVPLHPFDEVVNGNNQVPLLTGCRFHSWLSKWPREES